MLDQVIAITGAMRSGTSLVAQIVHCLGYQVSPIIPAPAPPSWRSDWEDPRLTEKLMRREPIDWHTYVRRRRDESEATGFERFVAIKSPYLALQWDTLCAAVPIFSIGVFRDEEDRAVSRMKNLSLSAGDDAEICEAIAEIRNQFSLRVGYGALVFEPEVGIERIAKALKTTWSSSHVAIVGQPTNYESCPQ